MSTHTTDEVKAHYAQLAATYEARANKACKRAYIELVRKHIPAGGRVLEIGAGAGSLLPFLDCSLGIACDLSRPMLQAQQALNPDPDSKCLAGDAQQLPFADGSFDAVFSINLLEHVPDPGQVVEECGRILRPGGIFFGLTPNGDAAVVLDVLEKLHLKLPEGPHRFLTSEQVTDLAGDAFAIREQRKCLAFPAGPYGLVKAIDRVLPSQVGYGLFQYIVMERRVDQGTDKNDLSTMASGRLFGIGRKKTASGLPKDEYQELQDVLGSVLSVHGYEIENDDCAIIRRHVTELDLVPKALLAKLKRNGLRGVEIAPGSVSNFKGFEHLSAAQVPGRAKGITFNHIAGLYSSSEKRMIIGTKGEIVDGVVPHEIGHALGDLLNYDNDIRLEKAYRSYLNTMKQKGFITKYDIREKREFLAKMAEYAIINGEANDEWGLDFARFVTDVLLKGKGAKLK